MGEVYTLPLDTGWMPGRESQDRGTIHLYEEVSCCLGCAGLEVGEREGRGLWRIGGTGLAMPFLFFLPPEWDGRKRKWVVRLLQNR